MDKTKRDNRIKALGKFRYLLWTFEDKIWKLLNKIFRVNSYSSNLKPQWLSINLYLKLKEIYKIRVVEPYYKMTLQEMKDDFVKDSNLQKFEKYLN